MDRVCIYIDGSNLYKSCQRNGVQGQVDISRFTEYLVGSDRKLIRNYYFMSRLSAKDPDVTEDAMKRHEGFIRRVESLPYTEVRFGSLAKRDHKCSACGNIDTHRQEKGVDMRIGVNMLSDAVANNYDTAVLVSGDADLAEAVRSVKALGRHVEVASFADSRSYELKQVADVARTLTTELMNELVVVTKKRRLGRSRPA